MSQKRCTSANSSQTFASLEAFVRTMADRLYGQCECDGRGCVICISSDAMREAATAIEKGRSDQLALDRPYMQHTSGCPIFKCANCGYPAWLHDPTMDLDDVTCIQSGGGFMPKHCGPPCGLADHLQAGKDK